MCRGTGGRIRAEPSSNGEHQGSPQLLEEVWLGAEAPLREEITLLGRYGGRRELIPIVQLRGKVREAGSKRWRITTRLCQHQELRVGRRTEGVEDEG